ncbi:unnamed protein product (macronuclear) [Paramecium tetraurelia]|uniref:Structural maintenance of chromosomes protein n=1 Tax=Paramecium tetraurelia TaxID=5888 RepID=A0DC09_PARTE|nr:uncharacterized protein GSPATT00015453001 [Paramecium tetraurelia]CAK80576.1 unnamed protein product [Paramecium tetraurelia]|eukprot:XP_001447973.1 hypothetical protein (macronuclear) [Paramecium tetraurelia strain d4-2]
MWIKEIIIEGFKSYAQRTVITSLDPEFNAITGLNGSGKSNILDAILFCLGLSKEYDTLRIKKLQELIYKNGAAGITKAEVTIVFDNRNKEQSPLGYQDCDKITVTRQITADKSKYFINGKSETQKNFKNMFRSVQLNIDNPHFLVAQGRITKIINLKPQELISMLEETAGTSLYNEKKREAQKLIQKKEEKLKQVNEIIETEIQPQMQKLTDEKNIFQLWRAQEAQILVLKKDLFSYDYYQKAKTLRMKKNDLQIVNEQISNQEEKMRYENAEISTIQEKIQSLQEQNRNNKYDQITEKYKEKQKLRNQVQNTRRQKETIESEKIKLEHALRTYQTDKQRTDQKVEIADRQLKQVSDELKEKKELLDEQMGQQNSSEDGNIAQNGKQMIQRQINDTISHIDSNRKDLEQVTERLQKPIYEIDVERKPLDLRNQKLSYQKKKNRVKRIGDPKLLDLKSNRGDLDQQLLEIKKQISQSQPFIFQLNLSRMKDWDQNRVYGKLFSLFEHWNFGAGAKLQNIVVDDSTTSTYLLKNNVLQTHSYIIPNKEIQSSEAKREFVQAAAQIAKENDGFAKPAIDLISFSDKVINSMKFVFGNFIIASSMDIARKIAYHPSNVQKCKVVTRDGDIVDPSGTLTGGYTNEKAQLLPKFKQFNKWNLEYKEIQGQIDKIESQIEKIKQDIEFKEQLNREITQDKYQLEQLMIKQRKSNQFNFQTEQNKYLNEIQDLQVEQDRLKKQIKEGEDKLVELKKELQLIQQGKNTKELIQAQIDRTKKEINKLKQQIDQQKKELIENQVESQNYEQEITKCIKKIKEETNNLDKTSVALEQLTHELNGNKDQYLKITEEKNLYESKNAIHNNQMTRLLEQLQERQKYLNSTVEQLNGHQNELKKLEREQHDLKQQLKSLEDQYDFIRQDKNELSQDRLSEKFRVLETMEYEKTKQQFQRLEHDQGKLGKQVNFKVEAMTEQVEKEFQSLKDKKLILENDKCMLIQNMGELDDKKIKTIEKCFLEVNKDFSSIFSSLLHNAQAKLGRLDGLSIEDGIEMNVSFSHQQKNLSELSGGQRSLLALSFILALLKYKPAPFYILDEVDSALDLSHTENIGQMLSQNFKQSQFLLISLKEGMYQNANVLYKVQFVDGVSKIDRHELKKKKQQQLK